MHFEEYLVVITFFEITVLHSYSVGNQTLFSIKANLGTYLMQKLAPKEITFVNRQYFW